MNHWVFPCTLCGHDLKQVLQIAFGKRTTPESTLMIRPFTSVLIVLTLLAGAAFMGSMLIPSGKQTEQGQHIAQLQYENRHLTSKLSETEAILALRDGQIEGMQQQLLRNSHETVAMKQRLAMFDDVLAARKVGGWHILHPTAEWQDDQSIAYHLVVVKGENYPRWAKGHLSFSVIAANGDLIPVQNRRGKRALKFDMTTHAFFEGMIPWSKAWQPKILYISLFDKRGKNSQQIEIPILNRHALKPVAEPFTTMHSSQEPDNVIQKEVRP